jgi:hypothetical protein
MYGQHPAQSTVARTARSDQTVEAYDILTLRVLNDICGHVHRHAKL